MLYPPILDWIPLEYLEIGDLCITFCRDQLIEELEKQISAGFDSLRDVNLITIAAMMLYQIGNYEYALKVLHQADELEW